MHHDFLKQQVIVPSGKCPVQLADSDERSVLDWINSLIESNQNKIFLPCAYKYWIRQIFYNDPEKMKEAINVVNEKLGSRTIYDEVSEVRE